MQSSAQAKAKGPTIPPSKLPPRDEVPQSATSTSTADLEIQPGQSIPKHPASLTISKPSTPTGFWMLQDSPLFSITEISLKAGRLLSPDVPSVYASLVHLLLLRREGEKMGPVPPYEDPFQVKRKLSVGDWLDMEPSKSSTYFS
jgi:hypothetical protein